VIQLEITRVFDPCHRCQGIYYKLMIRFFANIWMILTLNCEQSARLTSQSFDRDLNWAETAAIKLHQLICSKSRKLDKQLVMLNQAFERMYHEQGSNDSDTLSDSARERIRERLDKETR